MPLRELPVTPDHLLAVKAVLLLNGLFFVVSMAI
jgi:hypothetical protein